MVDPALGIIPLKPRMDGEAMLIKLFQTISSKKKKHKTNGKTYKIPVNDTEKSANPSLGLGLLLSSEWIWPVLRVHASAYITCDLTFFHAHLDTCLQQDGHCVLQNGLKVVKPGTGLWVGLQAFVQTHFLSTCSFHTSHLQLVTCICTILSKEIQ